MSNEKPKKFQDKMKDWYKITGASVAQVKKDKNYKQHLINPCSMILVIGPTGSGKTTFLTEFLSRKNASFYQVIICSFSTTDEPLYNFLKNQMPEIELIDNIDELPDLKDFKDCDKNEEKLIVFDDFINLNKKQKEKIQAWFNSARKFGFTGIALVQNYNDCPPQMRRNAKYIVIFKLNDLFTINTILRNCNILGKDKQKLKEAYFECIQEPKGFMMLDLTDGSPMPVRHCFLDPIQIT